MKKLMILLVCAVVSTLMLSSCGEKQASNLNCEKHGIAKTDCAFCDKSLVESKGYCNEHKVAEALCAICSPAIIPAYKKEHDWCKEHNTPESLCPKCN